jgi:hypothetical protein
VIFVAQAARARQLGVRRSLRGVVDQPLWGLSGRARWARRDWCTLPRKRRLRRLPI